jgi:hypothetical protein
MRFDSSHSRFALLSAIVLSGCFGASAQTNQIAHLLTTNRPGQYRLEPVWVGALTQTVATGFFATHTNTPAQNRSKTELRFDLFSYFEQPSALRLGSRVVSQSIDRTAEGWRHTKLHSYRDTLPTDSQLVEAHTVAALTNLLGASQGFTDGWGDSRAMHSSARWTFFRIKHDVTLETLSVSCHTTHTNGQMDTYVDSIRIQRGTARPAR